MKTLFKDYHQFLLAVIIGSLFFSCTKDDLVKDNFQEKEEAITESLRSDLIPGQYIVTISNDPAKKNSKAKISLQSITKEMLKMPGAKLGYEYTQTLTGFSARLTEDQVKLLKKDSRVESVVQDQYVYPTGEISVQNYPTWGLDRIDQRGALLDRAYGSLTTGKGVTAYIIDTGIRYTHEEFGGRASLGYDFVLDEDPENTDPNQAPGEDCKGHGTHVAGTVGGVTYGVAKEVNLVSVRVFGCSGGASASRVIAAVEWVTANAVHPAVVNMSLGGEALDVLDNAVTSSIEAGINYTISAGNNDNDACLKSPARTSGALTVGASDINNNKAYFSNFGVCVDIFAPGVSITSAYNLDDSANSIYSGTSMAAPHIAGMVALYLQEHLGATPEEVHSIVINNSTPNAVNNVPIGTNNLAYSLYEPVEVNPPTPPDLNLNVFAYKDKRDITYSLTWDVTEDPNVNIYRNGSFYSIVPNNGLYTFLYRGRGDDVFQVCEINYNNCSEVKAPIFVDDPANMPNQPPVAIFDYVSDGLSVSFIDRSGDNDGGSILKWSWDFGDGNTSSLQNPTHIYGSYGYYRAALTVTDDRDGIDTNSRWINVVEPEPEPEPVDLVLTTNSYRIKGQEYTELTWTPAGSSEEIDIYLNGRFRQKVPNNGFYTDKLSVKGSSTLIYKVCISNSVSVCSNEVISEF